MTQLFPPPIENMRLASVGPNNVVRVNPLSHFVLQSSCSMPRGAGMERLIMPSWPGLELEDITCFDLEAILQTLG